METRYNSNENGWGLCGDGFYINENAGWFKKVSLQQATIYETIEEANDKALRLSASPFYKGVKVVAIKRIVSVEVERDCQS